MASQNRSYKLTGRVSYRLTWWRRKLVLQVEETPPNRDFIRMRDATIDDMLDLGALGNGEVSWPHLRLVR